MKTIRLAALVSSIGLLVSAHPALAADATATLEVSATVNSSCTINTAPLAFGTYDPAATTPTDGTGQVTIACVKGSLPVISLSAGLNSTDVNARSMLRGNGTESLSYVLYKPEADGTSCSLTPTEVWGDATPSNLVLSEVTSVDPVTYSVCGRINPSQDVPAGTYQDTVTATVTF